jgi:hypothetical protein
VTILAVAEYRKDGNGLWPTFAFARIETLADLTRYRGVTVLTVKPRSVASKEFLPGEIIPTKNQKQVLVKSKATKTIASSVGESANTKDPNALKYGPSENGLYFSLAWSETGREPSKEESLIADSGICQ